MPAACGVLLVGRAAVSVDAAAAIRDAAQAYISAGSGTSWLFAKFRCERSSVFLKMAVSCEDL
eukprot:scaffold19997_cov84-Cyclotella_meneghiniana.AAC.1